MKKILFGKKWFIEESETALGESNDFIFGMPVRKEVYSGKSRFQNIDIFDTMELGRVLALDGFIQLSSKYEFIYHEMLVHPALLYHSKPERVLIVGGGDGGVLREVVKYPVKEIFLVDIDKKVVDASKKYLPSVSGKSFEDKRLNIFYQDALKFVKNYKNYFDIVIDDLSDPHGPAVNLWKNNFYKDISLALKPEGVAAFQTGYLEEKFAQKARKKIKKTFPFFKVHRAFVPCFPFNEHTFSFSSKKINLPQIEIEKISKRKKQIKLATKYYSPEIHFVSSVFPDYYVNH